MLALTMTYRRSHRSFRSYDFGNFDVGLSLENITVSLVNAACEDSIGHSKLNYASERTPAYQVARHERSPSTSTLN